MGTGPVTTTARAEDAAGTVSRRWRSWRGAVLMLVLFAAVAAIGAYLTAPRPGGRMDPNATGPHGAHALVTLLRDGGVEVVVAGSVADVERSARRDTLILIAQSQYLTDRTVLDRLTRVPGDLLLVEPTSRTREALAPGLHIASGGPFNREPNCPLREAVRAGPVRFGPSSSYGFKDGRELTSCYNGALIRYRDDGRTVTVVGSSDFMTNGACCRRATPRWR